MSPSTIGDGYTVLPFTISPIPAFPQATEQTVYLRPHAPKIPTENDARSLFLVNVPIDSTAEHIRSVIKQLVGSGRCESVTFDGERTSASAGKELVLPGEKAQSKKRKRDSADAGAENEEWRELPKTWDRELRRSGGSAVVVLVDEKSVQGVLKAVRKLHKGASKSQPAWPIWGLGTESKVPALGSARYAQHQKLRYPDPKEISANVNSFMEAFNAEEERQKKEGKRRRNEVDDDGFVTVSRGGRTGVARQEVLELKKVEMEEKERRKREERGDFYRFQGREKRREQQEELVRRFGEDRERVAKLKEARGKFRPER